MLTGLGITSGAADPFVFPTVTPDPNPVIVHGTGGELFTFLKTAATTNGSYSLGDAVFTTGPLPHIHHREDEWFYVVSGQVDIEMGDDVYPDITQVPGINLPKETMHGIIAGPGTLVWAPRYHLHAFQSADGNLAEMYVVMAPGGLDQFFANTEGKSPEEQSRIALDYGFNLSIYPSQYVAGIDDNFMMDDNHASELLALLAATPVAEPPSWSLLCVSILGLAGMFRFMKFAAVRPQWKEKDSNSIHYSRNLLYP